MRNRRSKYTQFSCSVDTRFNAGIKPTANLTTCKTKLASIDYFLSPV